MELVVVAVLGAFVSAIVWLIRNWNATGPTDLWHDDDIDRQEAPHAQGLRAPGRPDPHAKHPLTAIGYWASEEHPDRPVCTRFVDPSWDAQERDEVRRYLEAGVRPSWPEGEPSVCPFCGAVAAFPELTDGVYVWPGSLAHEVEEHGVRLPGLFVLHVHRSAGASVDGDILVADRTTVDVAWWGSVQEP